VSFFRKQKQRQKRKDALPSVLCCRTRALASWQKRGEERSFKNCSNNIFIHAASIGIEAYRYYCRRRAELFGSIGIVHANSSPWALG
jgi:hypothetical protein